MAGRHSIAEIGEEFRQLLGKIMSHDPAAVALQRECRSPIGARRASYPEIDPAGRERREQPKRLGHFERRIVRQHDTARTNPDPLRLHGYRPDQSLRCGPGQARRRMMLGQPVTVKAEGVAMTSEIERIGHGIGGRRSLGDGRLVKDGQGISGMHYRGDIGPSGTIERPVPPL